MPAMPANKTQATVGASNRVELRGPRDSDEAHCNSAPLESPVSGGPLVQAAARRHDRAQCSAQALREPNHEPPIQRFESKVNPCAGIHGHQPLLVAFGRRSDSDSIEINLILLVQPGTLARDFR